MGRILASNNLLDFSVTRDADVSMVTASATYADTDAVTNAIRIKSRDQSETTPAFRWDHVTAMTGTVWVHGVICTGGVIDFRVDGTFWALFDVNGNEVARLDAENGEIRAYASGDSVVVGAGTLLTADTIYTFDLSVAVTSGSVVTTLHINQSDPASPTASSTATATNTTANFGVPARIDYEFEDVGFDAAGYLYMSEILIYDEGDSTIGKRVWELIATGDGFHTDFGGSYADISDQSTSTAISADATGQQQSWELSDPTIPSGMQIEALCVTYRGKVGGGGVSNFDALLRVGSTDYLTSAIAISAGQGQPVFFAQNPQTLAAWTQSDIASLQVGVATS